MLKAQQDYAMNSVKHQSTYILLTLAMKMTIWKLLILVFPFTISINRLLYQVIPAKIHYFYILKISPAYSKHTQSLKAKCFSEYS